MKTTMETPLTQDENLILIPKIRLDELTVENEKLKVLVKYYEEQFRLYQSRQFGRSSEQTDLNQLNLFNEAEALADTTAPEPEYEEITYKRRKTKGKREKDLSGLPVERIDYELPEEDRVCPECGAVMHDIGVDVRREIEIVPAKAIVIEHAKHSYACRDCEKNSDHTPIIAAETPNPLIPGSLASASAVSYIANQKYVNCVPLYRLEQEFKRDGIPFSRQNMANWVVYCAENYLSGVYSRMITYLLKEDVLHADETTVQVLHEAGRDATQKSYEWLYRTTGCAEHAIVIYEYCETRAAINAQDFLSGYQGFLHCDGYQAYHTLSAGIIIVGCWTHARRKFEDAYKVLTPEQRSGSKAECGRAYIDKLFRLEKEFAALPPDERYQQRIEKSKPLSDAFFAWAESVCLEVTPSSAIGKAVRYASQQRQYLENVFLDGRLELSNNRAERSIKPFVMGRKNWLFSNTPAGASASSVLYSMIETAKENGLIPFQYLKYLLERLPNGNISDVEELLPWSDSLPDYCKAQAKPEGGKSL
jgi:transposase